MPQPQTQALVAAVVLALVHLHSGRMRFLGHAPRSAWLSAFAGISVAYVFVHLLPELAEGQAALDGANRGEGGGEQGSPLLAFLEDHVYVMALVGLLVFYGVERHSLASRRDQYARSGEDCTAQDAFWLSIASFAVYNAIVGYLLLRGELGELPALALYTVALAVHFVVNDFGLREHHKGAYTRIGRWIIAAAVLIGWLLGITTDIPQRVIALVIAFIAGGVILNVLKEELPTERRAPLMPFLAGAILYTVLLQVA
ncbi:MAG: hypothetical protein H0W96_03050 [Solirubrobacterales bacterium]|nr:hypothetical protein [Solirubrobacterales bacterium]